MQEQADQIEADRVHWYERRPAIEGECRRQGQLLRELTCKLRQTDEEGARHLAERIRAGGAGLGGFRPTSAGMRAGLRTN